MEYDDKKYARSDRESNSGPYCLEVIELTITLIGRFDLIRILITVYVYHIYGIHAYQFILYNINIIPVGKVPELRVIWIDIKIHFYKFMISRYHEKLAMFYRCVLYIYS